MFDRLNRLINRVMYIPILAVICAYIYLGTFNRLLADDYCVVYYGERLGLFRSIWYWYITWHGAYSASTLDWVLSAMGKDILPWTTLFYLGALISTSSGVVNLAAFRTRTLYFSVEVSLLLGMLLAFMILVAAPSIPQSLIWWSGARGYFAPLVGIMLYFLIYFHFSAREWLSRQKTFWYFISFMVVFLSGGFAEVYTPVQFILFWGIVVWGWRWSKIPKKDLYFLCAGAVGASISLVVMVLAPGNALRQEFFPINPDILTIVEISIRSYLGFLWSTLFTGPSATAVWGGLLLSGWLGAVNKDLIRKHILSPFIALVILVVGVVLAFGSFIPSVYGTAEPPPPRTLIVSIFFLFCGILAFGFLIGGWLGNTGQKGYTVIKVMIILAVPLVIYSSITELSVVLSIRDTYVAFAEKWDAVDMQIKDAVNAGQAEVVIPPMINWANLEYPTDNRRYWPNKCYTRYYGIQILSSTVEP